MDPQSLHLLEFESVLEILQGFAHCQAGREKIRAIRPFRDLERIQEKLSELEEVHRFSTEHGRITLRHLEDPTGLLSRLDRDDEVLAAADLLLLLDYFRLADHLKRNFQKPGFARLASRLSGVQAPRRLVETIEASIGRNGEILDSAHPELAGVRRKAAESRNQVQQLLEKFLKGSAAKHLIDDPFVTQRAGRYVVPVRVESQGAVPGIVHATSSSGATVFVEPFNAVELNNRQIYFRERETEIARQVLAELSAQAREHREAVRGVVEQLGSIDAAFASVDFQDRYRGCRPTLNREKRLRLDKARHPLLLKTLGDRQVVPISMELDEENPVVVISGPNTGGKTVALKTVGLFCLMAQSGLPVPAERAELPCLENVFADIGDHQSIMQHLSTFSAHIRRIQSMFDSYDPPALVLLDEVGRGTDPVYGAPLAVAIIESFRKRGALLLATTHHGAVKTYSASTPGVSNASVRIDPVTFEPTFQLDFGVAGSSSGLEIAERLGLSPEIVAAARTRLNATELEIERYLEELQKEQAALEATRADELRKGAEWERRKRDLEEASERALKEQEQRIEKRIEKLGKQFEEEISRYLQRLEDRQRAKEIRQESRRRQEALKEAFRRKSRQEDREAQPDPSSPSIEVGDTVYHQFFKKKGRVLSVEEEQATVEIEGKRVPARLTQLSKVESRTVTRTPSRQISVRVVEDTDPELNLIGKTVDEASAVLDKYLDRAFVSQLKEVRIIHGFGTGRLRKAVASILETHPHVQTFEVEGGVTRVLIKN